MLGEKETHENTPPKGTKVATVGEPQKMTRGKVSRENMTRYYMNCENTPPRNTKVAAVGEPKKVTGENVTHEKTTRENTPPKNTEVGTVSEVL